MSGDPVYIQGSDRAKMKSLQQLLTTLLPQVLLGESRLTLLSPGETALPTQTRVVFTDEVHVLEPEGRSSTHSCSSFVRRVIALATDPSISERAMPVIVGALKTEFLLKAKLFKHLTNGNVSHGEALTKAGLFEADRKMMLFWASRCDNKGHV